MKNYEYDYEYDYDNQDYIDGEEKKPKFLKFLGILILIIILLIIVGISHLYKFITKKQFSPILLILMIRYYRLK